MIFSKIFAFFANRFALVVIFAQSPGMAHGPRGRSVSALYALNVKGLYNVKKDIRGCGPPGGNTRRRR